MEKVDYGDDEMFQLRMSETIKAKKRVKIEIQ